MAETKQRLRGEEALQILESSASRDLKRTRQLVEEASMADIASYFKGAGLGELAATVNAELVSAAIAGGQWGFNALVSRLASTDVHEADYENVANEILEIISPLAKILNYARFRATAIQSYVAQCGSRSLKLQSINLSKTELSKYEDQVASLQKSIISNAESLEDWVNAVDLLCGDLSEKEGEITGLSETTNSSRHRRMTVSTKSISSYSKHWKSYAPEILLPEIGLTWNGDKKDSIVTKVEPLVSYKPRNWAKLQNDLNETVSTRRFYRSATKDIKTAKTAGKQITAEHYIDTRLLSISYNLPGIDEDLIQPAINSIRAQLMRTAKQAKVSFTMKTDSNFLSIEMEKASKEDLETLKILLSSHRQ
jgi:hypothetical protein